MGDADNALPPSKKRAAGREISRDNPGLDDDDEDASEQECGTFKRASDEVLASRRIVKVRRQQTSSAPSVPSSNPFAAIRLVPPPTNPSVAPAASVVEESDKTVSEKVEEKIDVNEHESDKKAENKAVEEGTEQTEAVKEATKPESADVEGVEGEKIVEKEDKKDDGADVNVNVQKSSEAASVSSFQQLSSSQNAFTGIVGTGFSNSSFSFGSLTKSDQPSFPSFPTNGNSSLFGNIEGSSASKNEASKIPPMQAVPLETGEENEEVVFTADSALFEFLDGGWKERGKGELKVNVFTSGTGKARLVMRAKGNYRLILNASLFPDMKLTNMEKRGITFACVNSNGEGKDGLSTFALKFKDASIVEEFRAVVTKHKGETFVAAPASAALKTPENSPKASDE